MPNESQAHRVELQLAFDAIRNIAEMAEPGRYGSSNLENAQYDDSHVISLFSVFHKIIRGLDQFLEKLGSAPVTVFIEDSVNSLSSHKCPSRFLASVIPSEKHANKSPG